MQLLGALRLRLGSLPPPFPPFLFLPLILRIWRQKNERNEQPVLFQLRVLTHRSAHTLNMVHLFIKSQFHRTHFLQHIKQPVPVVE